MSLPGKLTFTQSQRWMPKETKALLQTPPAKRYPNRMRYCRFQHANGSQYGLIQNRNSEDFITELLPPWPENANAATGANAAFQPIAVSKAKLLAPTVPSKIICVGRN